MADGAYLDSEWGGELGPPARGVTSELPAAPAAPVAAAPPKRKKRKAKAEEARGEPALLLAGAHAHKAPRHGAGTSAREHAPRTTPAVPAWLGGAGARPRARAAPRPADGRPGAHDRQHPAAPPQPTGDGASKLQRKLQGARFRVLNEQLYTCHSSRALQMMRSDPSLFQAYHAGFRAQAARWPANPLRDVIAWVRALPADAVVGDFGCGDAELAASVPHRVHSFDLVAANERVTACDIAHTPLRPHALDAAVFCLALMGSNWADFLREAHRVLKPGGRLKIVEVRSRVTDPRDFSDSLRRLGFDAVRAVGPTAGGRGTGAAKGKGTGGSSGQFGGDNTHFVILEFARGTRDPEAGVAPKPLAACIYKRR